MQVSSHARSLGHSRLQPQAQHALATTCLANGASRAGEVALLLVIDQLAPRQPVAAETLPGVLGAGEWVVLGRAEGDAGVVAHFRAVEVGPHGQRAREDGVAPAAPVGPACGGAGVVWGGVGCGGEDGGGG
jgi:hypothetical protein